MRKDDSGVDRSMKMCPKCKTHYKGECEYCVNCGEKLISDKEKNKRIGVVTLVGFLLIFVLGISIHEQFEIKKAQSEIENYRNMKALEELLSTPTNYDLTIEDGWTSRRSGGYEYISGTVTNSSMSKTISYYEIEAIFYDEDGNMVDSDWTNDAQDLKPGERRRFEIMHKYEWNEKDISLKVREVS